MIKKVVLAYSGGLDTSIIIPWLKENYGCEVIALTVDVGQGEDLEAVRAKALQSGASAAHVLDAREEFLRDYVFPVLKAGALYEGKYLLGTAMARPLIAKKLVEVARQEGADAVAHGATGKGNDQVRFELGVRALAPDLRVIAPWREWSIRSRSEAMAYAAARGIPVPTTPSQPYSRDQNLWHLSHEGGVLEDPAQEPPRDLYQLVRPPEDAPDRPSHLKLTFRRGEPVALDERELPPVPLLEELNRLAGEHGVGVADLVENRLVGIKSRGVYETPGGTVLFYALRELERLVFDRATLQFKNLVAWRYGELVYDGWWFSPLREALDAFVASLAPYLTGEVRLKLYKGNLYPAGTVSPYSLYRRDLATFEADELYDQKDASGFIRIFGLPLWVQAMRGRA
ncbi:argininosuccinate synthase [Desulfothermobacter acidiphilus]|uniref:argininosuccinate synthase n=1 Tax=Desulfothermobacter acidiphilus TaxID=1938353 RepID=UPI003F8C307B